LCKNKTFENPIFFKKRKKKFSKKKIKFKLKITKKNNKSFLITFFSQSNPKIRKMSDLDRQIDLLRKCECIKESEVKLLCAKAREILVEESNVQRVDAPVTVIPAFS